MKQPIRKKYKKSNKNGTDRGTNIQGLYSGPINYAQVYGRTPQIDPSLPIDGPTNTRAAIAQQQGWTEVPISAVDLDANQEWIESILASRQKYGDNATYIVDPNTRKIIPQSTFDNLITNKALENTSGNISNKNIDFETQQSKNHKSLQNRDPQKLGGTLIGLGALPFVLGPAISAAAPAMPYIKPALSALNFGYGGYNAAKAIDDVAKGDYEGAAIHGGLAASTVVPTGAFSGLSLWPKIGATLGYGAGTTALVYADEQHNNSQTEQKINDLARDKNYIINDAEEQEILEYLQNLGYDTSRFNVRKYAGSDKYAYEITSGNGDDNLDQSEPISNWFSDRGNRMLTYFGTKYGTKYGIVPTYKFITGKRVNRPQWAQRLIKRIPQSFKTGARKFAGTTWSDALYLGLEALASHYEDNDVTSGLTDAQKTAVANALILLGTKYPELQFYNISPELQTGKRLTDTKDTTDYIPGLPEIINYPSQQSTPNQYDEVEDTALTNNAPSEF